MTPASTRIAAGFAALITVVTLCACGRGEDHGAHSPTTTAAVGQAAVHNADDVMFARMMIPHHEQAVALAAMVPERSTNAALITLASTISGQQRPEIEVMQALLRQWDLDPNADHAGMDMPGMVDEATMARLDGLTGREFDRLWLQSMISHHHGAIEVAGTEIATGKSAGMVALAKNIVTAQQAEIDQMNQMLGG